jgi:DNA-binding response OmpR family regulator
VLSIFRGYHHRFAAGYVSRHSLCGEILGELPVLVVDDDEALLGALTEFLRAEGYLAQPASSGDVALILLQQGIQFGLLISDVVLPGFLDGFTLARRVRLLYPSIPIIYTTGHPEVAHVRGRGAPFGEILTKPYRVETLLRIISAVLQDRHELWRMTSNSSGLPHRPRGELGSVAPLRL